MSEDWCGGAIVAPAIKRDSAPRYTLYVVRIFSRPAAPGLVKHPRHEKEGADLELRQEEALCAQPPNFRCVTNKPSKTQCKTVQKLNVKSGEGERRPGLWSSFGAVVFYLLAIMVKRSSAPWRFTR